ncbi:coiled-coil domain-containing protein 83 [Lacerta agilis]|uniref:coiled-coil domain-containing protein 83 n=1 Tax=Lacerta agilis TaxID=80427 RepID=UPI0014198DFF|nr:coiled-coil domain-containing protein 83 [Lacerta agilis]
MAKEKKKKEKKGKRKQPMGQMSKEPRIYFPEALLAYQIQIKEEIIDQLLFEIKNLEAQNDQNKERNQQLKNEQASHIRALLAALKEQEEALAKVEIVTRDDVELAMKEKWQYAKDQEKLIKDMRCQIHYLEQKLVQKQAEVDYWLAYKNVGSTEHAKQIECLEQDIQKLKEELEEMTEFFRISLEETKERTDRYMLKQMELKKEWALENAVKHIDKTSCREIKEYEWLKEEVAGYKKEVSDLEALVHELEKENIYLTNKLFERRLQFLKVPRTLFLTQGAGLQMLEDQEHVRLSAENASLISEIVINVDHKDRQETVENLRGDSFEVIQLKADSAAQFLPPILYEDSNDFKEYKHLGPLAVKLMTTVGQTMPVHEDAREMPSRTKLEERYDSSRSQHHITYQMIKSMFH